MLKVNVIDALGDVTSYSLPPASSILQAFEDAGYQYPHGCRVGVCGACLSDVVAGIENLPAADAIERERLKELQASAVATESQQLAATNLRFCCRTPLTGEITLRPLAGTVKKKSRSPQVKGLRLQNGSQVWQEKNALSFNRTGVAVATQSNVNDTALLWCPNRCKKESQGLPASMFN